MLIFNILLRILCRQWLPEVWTHGHHQRLGFFFLMFPRSLLQLTSVVVCLWLFLSLVLSSASEMLLNRVEIRRLTRPLQNNPLFTFKNYWVAFAVCFVSLFICTMKRRWISFAACDWICAESISLYTSELIRLLLCSVSSLNTVTQSHWSHAAHDHTACEVFSWL